MPVEHVEILAEEPSMKAAPDVLPPKLLSEEVRVGNATQRIHHSLTKTIGL